jgi:hypothetical protein
LIYSIDTSALLDGWKRHYPPDVFPGIWDNIDEMVSRGDLAATEEVLLELEKGDDDLYDWARQRPQMFLPLDVDIQTAVTGILSTHSNLVDIHRSRSMADPFVIAVAQVHACAVVSGEVLSNSPTKIKIPNVCSDLGIRHINFLQLIREQGWIFRR